MEQFSVEALLKATDSGFVKTFKDAQEAVKTFEKKSNSMTTAIIIYYKALCYTSCTFFVKCLSTKGEIKVLSRTTMTSGE